MLNSRLWLVVVLCLALVSLAGCAEKQPGTSLSVEPPPSGEPGDDLILSGSGFNHGEVVDVQMWIGETPHGLGTGEKDVIEADEDGKFMVRSAIPVVAEPGTYKVTATGDEGNESSQWVKVTAE